MIINKGKESVFENTYFTFFFRFQKDMTFYVLLKLGALRLACVLLTGE